MLKVTRVMVLALGLATFAALSGPQFVSGQVKKGKKVVKPAPAPTGAAVFEMYKTKKGDYRFRLKDGKGTILAIASKSYKTKPDCQKVIDIIRANAAKATIHEVGDKTK